MKQHLNLQDVFLNQVRKDRIMITVFLISGYQIRGIVKGFDNYTVIMDSDGKQQMITVSTPYDSAGEEERFMSAICHEITHASDDPDHGIDPPDHGDNHGGPCIMGSGMEGMVPFCPVCGQKLGFSSYTEVSPPGFWYPGAARSS